MKIIQPKTTYYSMPTTLYFGRDVLNDIKSLLKNEKLKKSLIVCGEHFKRSNEFKALVRSLDKQPVEIYNEEIKICNFSAINTLSDYCRLGYFDSIIAVGGGTILDTAKCASILATHTGAIEEYIYLKTKRINRRGLFYIAIPTTSGTGSEITPWASIWGDDKKKYSLTSTKFMFPDIAIVDSALTDTLPSYVTAASGIDALCQAVEAYWNINHNKISDVWALQSIKVITNSLEKAVNNPTPKIREAMAWGSLCGGLAFSNTKTTICHAISYPLTAHWKIPHGQATSLTLPLFVQKIIPLLSKSRQKNLLSALEAETASEAATKITKLMTNIGLKTTFSELEITKEEIEQIAKESFYTDRINNTPLSYNESKLVEMLRSLY